MSMIVLFRLLSDSTCQYWSSNNSLCYLHNSQNFGNYMNILSAVLSLVAVILDAILFFYVKDLDLYGDGATAQPRPVEMRPIHRPAIETAIDGKNHFILFASFQNVDKFSIFAITRHFTGG